MAKQNKKVKPSTPLPAPVVPVQDHTSVPTPKTTPPKRSVPAGPMFLFDSTNYKWMIGGVILIILGFILMSGGKSDNVHQFNYDEIYSFRRVTLAPLVVLLGFAIEFYAIMRKPKTIE